MDNVFEPAVALGEIALILDRFRFPYFLVGSFASGFRGDFRATNDLDIVCHFTRSDVGDFIDECKRRFYTDELAIPEAIRNSASFNLIHEETFVKVDFFTQIGDFEREQFGLCSRLKIPSTEIEVNVSTAEYNIIAKMNWYRKSNGVLDRQLTDVKGMLKINEGHLDWEYLNRWSQFYQTTELLQTLCEAI